MLIQNNVAKAAVDAPQIGLVLRIGMRFQLPILE